jgi:hypothetical protein
MGLFLIEEGWMQHDPLPHTRVCIYRESWFRLFLRFMVVMGVL